MRIERLGIGGALLAIALATLPVAARSADLPPLPPLDHFMVAISVADLEAETAWYVEKLGFAVERDVELGDGRIFFRWLTRGNERIELVHSPTAAPGTPRPLPPAHAGLHGLTHLTLETADLAATRAALAARGVTPVMDITTVKELGISVLYLRDPEGNYVEIVERLKN